MYIQCNTVLVLSIACFLTQTSDIERGCLWMIVSICRRTESSQYVSSIHHLVFALFWLDLRVFWSSEGRKTRFIGFCHSLSIHVLEMRISVLLSVGRLCMYGSFFVGDHSLFVVFEFPFGVLFP